VLLVVAATPGELAGVPDGVDTLACGIGPVEAGIATAAALAERRPEAVLHVGIAGARRGSGLVPTDLVIGAEARWTDFAAAVPTPVLVRPAEALLAAARRALPEARVLPIGTSARVGGTSGVDVEAMEGFAVLRAAELAGVPAVEVRAVANEIEEPDRSRWRFREALDAVVAATPLLVEELTVCVS
jgi:nucleoside phosphorylase